MDNESSIEKLKFFLKEMFQFNSNDLDFGIYRIYNLKRREIEDFIDCQDDQCLEPIINRALELVSNLEKEVELASLTTYLKKFNQESLVNDPAANFQKIEQLIVNFGDDDQQKDRLLTTLNTSTKAFNITDEIKDKIYNHILGFFEMYYSNGDFGYNNRSRNLYKVPYEADYDGNDTMFHWKHKGSLYIKTGNSFNAIKFKQNITTRNLNYDLKRMKTARKKKLHATTTKTPSLNITSSIGLRKWMASLELYLTFQTHLPQRQTYTNPYSKTFSEAKRQLITTCSQMTSRCSMTLRTIMTRCKMEASKELVSCV